MPSDEHARRTHQADVSLYTKATSKQGIIAIVGGLGIYFVIAIPVQLYSAPPIMAFALGMFYTIVVNRLVKWLGEWFKAEREAVDYV